MAVDPNVTVEGLLQHVQRELSHAERQAQKTPKDEENQAYYSGKIDILVELEAIIQA